MTDMYTSPAASSRTKRSECQSREMDPTTPTRGERCCYVTSDKFQSSIEFACRTRRETLRTRFQIAACESLNDVGSGYFARGGLTSSSGTSPLSVEENNVFSRRSLCYKCADHEEEY